MNPAQLLQSRSSLLIFRDCLKLASRMVDNPVKIKAVRALIKHEFNKNRDVIEQDQIRELKLGAVRGISNYIIHTVKEQYKLPRKNPNIFEDDEQQQQTTSQQSQQQ